MGGGSVSVLMGKNQDRQTIPMADYINQELLHRFRRIEKNESASSKTSSLSQPYFEMSTDEALIMILDLLSMKDQRSKAQFTASTTTVATGTLLAPKTRLELACISSIFNKKTNQRRGRMIRKRIADVWGMRKKLIVT